MKKKTSTNPDKLNPEFIHDFYPLEEDKTVYLEVEHLRNGDLMSCADRENRDLDYSKLFLKKVKVVHGITVEGPDGVERTATPRDIVDIIDADFTKIIVMTINHLIENSNYTEEEAKN